MGALMPFEAPPIAWRAIAPELALVGGALVALVVDAMKPAVSRRFLAAWTLAAIGLASWFTYDLHDVRAVVMQGMIAVDGVALFGRLILLVVAAMSVLLSFDYLSRRRIHRGEYYPLLLLCTSGMTLLAASNDLLMVFLSIEVLSLALYVMVGFARRDDKSLEGALKYFLLGSFSSAFLLYGIAFAYGAAGSTRLSAIAEGVAGGADERLLLISMALIAVGFAFKIAAVPFHMWTPDAYQGAPTSVTGFMAAGTKAAAFVAFLRVFLVSFGALQWDWRPAMWILAVATMSVGSLLAIAQTDVKRMLAYSSIAHAGYVLIGLVAANNEGVSASLFYLLIYAVMVLGAFGAVVVSAPDGLERLSISEWAGVGRRHPLFGGAMTLFLLALAGIPPTAGFTGKFLLFEAALRAGENALVVVGAVTTVIAAFFYVRLIVLIWLQEPPPAEQPLGASPALSTALALASAGTLAFGIWPQALIDLARNAGIFVG